MFFLFLSLSFWLKIGSQQTAPVSYAKTIFLILALQMSLIKVWVFIQKLWLWLTWYFILSFIVPKLLPNFVSNMGRILGGLVRLSPWNQYRTTGLLLVFGGMELLANLLGFTSCWKQNFMINLHFKLFSITRPNYFLVVAFNKLFLYKCNYFTVFIYQIEVKRK